MGHKMVYSISGATYENLKQMHDAGLQDFWLVVHAGESPYTEKCDSFVDECDSIKATPCFQNGNDGKPGWDGTAQYYKDVAAQGFHAAGGESEQLDEINSIMANTTFGNFGGDWGGCKAGFSDIFYNSEYEKHPMAGQKVTGYGMSAWLETYTTFPGGTLCDLVVDAAIAAKKNGAFEVGFMIGYWMPVTADPYIKYAEAMEDAGFQCDGFNFWNGHEKRMWDTYTKWKPVFDRFKELWPPDMRTMKERFGGGGTTIIETGTGSAQEVFNGVKYSVVTGTDHALYMGKESGGIWTDWAKIKDASGSPGILTSSPSAKVFEDTLTIEARGNDGALWYLKMDKDGKFSKWATRKGKLLE